MFHIHSKPKRYTTRVARRFLAFLHRSRTCIVVVRGSRQFRSVAFRPLNVWFIPHSSLRDLIQQKKNTRVNRFSWLQCSIHHIYIVYRWADAFLKRTHIHSGRKNNHSSYPSTHIYTHIITHTTIYILCRRVVVVVVALFVASRLRRRHSTQAHACHKESYVQQQRAGEHSHSTSHILFYTVTVRCLWTTQSSSSIHCAQHTSQLLRKL